MIWANDFFFLTPEAVGGLILLLTKKDERATDTAQFYLQQIHPAVQRSRRQHITCSCPFKYRKCTKLVFAIP